MREIKFRAWDKYKKKIMTRPVFLYDRDRIRFTMSQESEYLWETDKYSDAYIFMQYTGLKDKNGVEIYEGDIVRREIEDDEVRNKSFFINMPVVFVNSWAGFGYEEHDNYFGMDELSKEFIEVVGNIYENPELLEGQS